MSQKRFIMSSYVTCDIQDVCTKETDVIRIIPFKSSGTAAGRQLRCFMGEKMTRTTCAKAKDPTQCVSLSDYESFFFSEQWLCHVQAFSALGDSVSSPAYAQLKFRRDVSPEKPHNCTFNMIMLLFSGLQLNSLVGARTKLIFSLNLQELMSTLFQLLGKSKEDKSSIK